MSTTAEILTLAEAAALVRMTPRWLSRSSCPRIRIGKYSRYERSAAGLPDYQLRDARHSVAIRWMVADAVAIWDVAERLGHSDQSEAIRTYTKTVLRDAAKRLGVDTHTTAKEA